MVPYAAPSQDIVLATLAALAQTDVDVSTVGQSADPRVSPPALIQQVAAGGRGPSAEGAAAAAAASPTEAAAGAGRPSTAKDEPAAGGGDDAVAEKAWYNGGGAEGDLASQDEADYDARTEAMESPCWSDDEQPPAAAGALRPGSQQGSQTEEEHQEALNELRFRRVPHPNTWQVAAGWRRKQQGELSASVQADQPRSARRWHSIQTA